MQNILLAPLRRRRIVRESAYRNALIWGLGNGLTSSTLVIYLANELGAPRLGLSIGLILAMRHLIGVLQLGAPTIIERWSGKKNFCITGYVISGSSLLALPLLASPGLLGTPGRSVAALVALWCFHHLAQYCGTTALFAWLAQWISLPARGRFFAVRARCLLVGESVGAFACGLFADQWKGRILDKDLHWLGYAIPAALGACFILASVWPLLKMPESPKSLQVARKKQPLVLAVEWKRIVEPFADVVFLRFLAFGCWFSFSNGLTQSSQFSFPMKTLGISLFVMTVAQIGMQVGQFAACPFVGKAVDRFGAVPVMRWSLLLTAQGPLFYFLSAFYAPSLGMKYAFLGAWCVWIAYAGLNVGLPHLTLKLAPPQSRPAYVAAHFTSSGLCYAAATLLGGYFYDHFAKRTWTLFDVSLNYDQTIFLAGWIARLAGLIFLAFVVERAGRDRVA